MRSTASVKDYPTPAPNAETIGKPLLAGRHLIVLNNSSQPMKIFKELQRRNVIRVAIEYNDNVNLESASW